MTRRLTLTSVAGALGLMAILATPVQAADAVRCTFIIKMDESHNVAPTILRTRELAHANEIEQFLAAEADAVKVAPFRDSQCHIEHTVNERVDVYVDREDLKRDKEGATPACEDLQIQVNCVRS